MITALINKYYYIIYEKWLTNIWRNVSIQYMLQTQLSIYAAKIMCF